MPTYPFPAPPMGMIAAGNIDVHKRPVVRNADGTISTVRSMSFGDENGQEIVVPTVSPDGRIMSDQEAVDLYYQTGQHLGKFRTPNDAEQFAVRLHDGQAEEYADQMTPPQKPSGGVILDINGRKVTVGDEFLSLSPEQQDATVDEIAQSLGPSGGVTQPAPSGPMIKGGGREIPVADYMKMPDSERQSLRDQIVDANPNAPGMARADPLGTFVQGTTFGWGDELRGAVQGGIAAAQGGDYGDTYKQVVDEARTGIDTSRRRNPVGSFALEMAGAMPTALAAGGGLVGQGASLGTRALIGGGVGAAQGAVYGAGAADGDMGERLGGAAASGAVGGAVGAAAPYIGNKVSEGVRRFTQGRAIDAAARGAPSAAQIENVASAMFEQSDNANPVISRGAFGRLYQNIENVTAKFRPNANLDPKATGALRVLTSMLDDVTKPGSNVLPDLKDIHLLRQAAQRAAVSSEGRDATIANKIVGQIDDFVRTLKPGDIAGGADPKTAANALMNGISLWSKANKTAIIEEAIFKAGNQASGVENGLRTQFRAILQNQKLRAKFTEAELQAISDVANGTPGMNVARVLGALGIDKNNKLMPLIAAAFTGPLGLAGIAAGTVARKGGERLATRAAGRAAGAVASGAIPVIPPVNRAIPSLVESGIRTMGVPVAGQVPPLRITVRP